MADYQETELTIEELMKENEYLKHQIIYAKEDALTIKNRNGFMYFLASLCIMLLLGISEGGIGSIFGWLIYSALYTFGAFLSLGIIYAVAYMLYQLFEKDIQFEHRINGTQIAVFSKISPFFYIKCGCLFLIAAAILILVNR